MQMKSLKKYFTDEYLISRKPLVSLCVIGLLLGIIIITTWIVTSFGPDPEGNYGLTPSVDNESITDPIDVSVFEGKEKNETETVPDLFENKHKLPGDVIQSSGVYEEVWYVIAEFYNHPRIPPGEIRSTHDEEDVEGARRLTIAKRIILRDGENVTDGLLRYLKEEHIESNLILIKDIDQFQRKVE